MKRLRKKKKRSANVSSTKQPTVKSINASGPVISQAKKKGKSKPDSNPQKARKQKRLRIKRILNDSSYAWYDKELISAESLDKVDLILQAYSKYNDHPALVKPEKVLEIDQLDPNEHVKP